MYEDDLKSIKSVLNEAENICITTDGWTSNQNYSYLSLTAHFVLQFKLISQMLGIKHLIGHHDGELIKNVLLRMLNDYKITNKVKFIVTDNGANINKAVDLLKQEDKLSSLEHVRCIGHIINLIIKTVPNYNETKKGSAVIISNEESTSQGVQNDYLTNNEDCDNDSANEDDYYVLSVVDSEKASLKEFFGFIKEMSTN